MPAVLVGVLRGRPCRHRTVLAVLLLRSPCPSASHRELLFDIITRSVASAAYICFIRCRSLEQSAWTYIPLHFSMLLKAHTRLIKCFLCLSLQPDDLVQLRLPQEHPAPRWWGLRLLSPGPGQRAGRQGGTGLPQLQWMCQGDEELRAPAQTCFGPQVTRGRVLGQTRAWADSTGHTASNGERSCCLARWSLIAGGISRYSGCEELALGWCCLPRLGREGWTCVGPRRALHPPGCGDAWLLCRQWEEGFLFLHSCCGKGLFSSK